MCPCVDAVRVQVFINDNLQTGLVRENLNFQSQPAGFGFRFKPYSDAEQALLQLQLAQ